MTDEHTPREDNICLYCGAVLDREYYFCLRCATPYTDLSNVLPVVRPKPLTDGDLIERRAPHAMPMFWTYLSVIVFTGIGSAVAFGSEHRLPQILLSEGAILATTGFFAARHWQSLAVQFGRLGLNQWPALVGVLALVPLVTINYFYHSWLARSVGQQPGQLFDQLRAEGLSHAGLIVIACVFPAIAEEIAFRGLLQHWLQVAIKPGRALLLASALFMVLHFSVVSAPYLLAVGLLLGWMKMKTGSLYPSMLVHFLHNFFVIELFRLA